MQPPVVAAVCFLTHHGRSSCVAIRTGTPPLTRPRAACDAAGGLI